MISRPIVFDIVYIPRKCSLENYNHILFFFKANRLVVVLIAKLFDILKTSILLVFFYL